MEKTIDNLLKCLIAELVIFFVIVISVFVLGYVNVIPNGILVGDDFVNTAYIFNTISVVLFFVAIWSDVRLFVLNTEKNIKRYTLDSAVKTYHVWSLIRLLITIVAILFSACTHFFTKEDIGLFCSIVLLLIVIIFCIPTKDKIKSYLEKVKSDSE